MVPRRSIHLSMQDPILHGVSYSRWFRNASTDKNRVLGIMIGAVQIWYWFFFLWRGRAPNDTSFIHTGPSTRCFTHRNSAVRTLEYITFPLRILDYLLNYFIELCVPLYPRAYTRKLWQKLRMDYHKGRQAHSQSFKRPQNEGLQLQTMNTQPGSHLCNKLPIELYSEIIQYLCHSDVVALGYTCKALHSALMPTVDNTHPSAVWKSSTCLDEERDECIACMNQICVVSALQESLPSLLQRADTSDRNARGFLRASSIIKPTTISCACHTVHRASG